MLIYGKLSAIQWQDIKSLTCKLKKMLCERVVEDRPLDMSRHIALHCCDSDHLLFEVSKKISNKITVNNQSVFKHHRASNKKLKIGYVSPDFHEHCVGLLILICSKRILFHLLISY